MKLLIVTLILTVFVSLGDLQAQTTEKAPAGTEHREHDGNHRHRRFRLFPHRHRHHHDDHRGHGGDHGQKDKGDSRSHRH